MSDTSITVIYHAMSSTVLYLMQRAKLFAYVNNIQITWKTI